MLKIRTIRRYTNQEARDIVARDRALRKEFDLLRPDYADADLDYGFEYGNFFNCPELRPNQVVIQWCDGNDGTHEYIAESLEIAVVVLRDIEIARGNLRV